MATTIEKSFTVNLYAMRFFGLYPPEKYKSLYKVQTYLMYFLLIVPVPLLETVNLFVQEDITFKQIADNVFLLAELVSFAFKLWPFLNNGERIKKCIKYFDSSFFEVRDEEQKEITRGCVSVCRKTTALFLTAVTCGFISWSSRPISWKSHIFPTDLWLPFDPQTAPRSYICSVYVYLVIAVGYGAYTSGVIDPLIGGLAYQATTQIKILKHNMQFINKHVEEEIAKFPDADQSLRMQITYNKIRRSVIHHNLIINFAKEYQECFSQIAFSQLVGGVVVLCVSVLQLTMVDIPSFDFLAMMMYLIAMLSESYLYCHFGTVLYEESNTIIEAIYLGNWYDLDLKSQKALIVLMERAKQPISVTVGKILDMSLVTFTMMLRRSYSLLAVLENYNIELN